VSRRVKAVTKLNKTEAWDWTITLRTGNLKRKEGEVVVIEFEDLQLLQIAKRQR
jgi:hypothetical protein